MGPNRLAIYLNDHLAAATAGLELARRCAGSNQGTDLGQALENLVGEIMHDREELEEIMKGAGVKVDRFKSTVAWMAEKIGRTKLNGSLISYSPLSRLEELELLVLAVEGKLLLWRTLRAHPVVSALTRPHLDRLIKRAEAQRELLEKHRLQAARGAL